MACFLQTGTKVLVTTGFASGSKMFEIIDLNDPSKACQTVLSDNYPLDRVTSASGGLLNNNTALLCGGLWRPNPEKVLDDCYAITCTGNEIEATIKLHQARFEAASVCNRLFNSVFLAKYASLGLYMSVSNKVNIYNVNL
jgi:hypothetical protein